MRSRSTTSATRRVLPVVRRIVDEFPTETWAEEALNNLATHYIIRRRRRRPTRCSARCSRGIRRPLRRAGRVEDRLARLSRAAATRTRFVSSSAAAADFPRSDYRPAWLYWSARAHEALGSRARQSALHAGRGRLLEHLLRPAWRSRGSTAPRRRRSADRSTKPDASGRVAAAERRAGSRPARRRSTTRPSTSCSTRRRPGATRRRFRRRWPGSIRSRARRRRARPQFALLPRLDQHDGRAYPQYMAVGGRAAAAKTCSRSSSRSTTGI